MIKLVFFIMIFSLIPFAFAQNDNTCNGLTDENPVIITTDKPNYTYEDSSAIVSICMSSEVYHKHIEMRVYDLHGNEIFQIFDPGFPNLNLEDEPYLFVQEVPLDSFGKWQKYTVELHASGEDYYTYFGYGADVFQEYFSEKYNYYIYPTTFWRLSPHTTDEIARFDAEAPSTIDTFPPYFEIIKFEPNEKIKFGDREKIAQHHTEWFENMIQNTIGHKLDFENDIIITATFAAESIFLHDIQVTMPNLDRAREVYSTAVQTDANEIFILTLYGSRAEVYDDKIQEFVDSGNTFTPLNEKQVIPEWIKNVFVWYGEGTVSEAELVSSLEFMISENIIEIVSDQQNSSEEGIPEWIKNVFVWYGEGTVSEAEMISALEFLISEGVIQVTVGDTIDAELSEPFVLDVGQTANILSEELSITFVDVLNDSRCPEDDGVNCSWAGDASVLIEIQDSSNNITEMILHSNTYNRGDDTYHFDKYEILLDHLLPRASEHITLPYKAIISVHETK